MEQESKKNKSREGGYAFIISIIVTSILVLISFTIINVSLRSLVLSFADQESQYAFYNADNGLECAIYWDTRSGQLSSFDTSTAGSITCNGQTVTTNSQSVPTSPPVQSRIGGGGFANPISIFKIDYTKGCVIVSVNKTVGGNTIIDSRGYNTCNTTSAKRYERGITITY